MLALTSKNWAPSEAGNYCKWCYRSTRLSELHRHDYHELFWVEAGEGLHRINGRDQILRVGDMVWIRAQDAHAFSVRKTGMLCEFVNVSFRSELWAELKAAHFPRSRTFEQQPDIGRRTFRLSHSQLVRLAALAEDLHAGHTDGLAVRAFALAAWSMCAPRPPHSTVAVPEWLRFACSQVVEYPNFTGGVAALVRLAGRSPEHVARACRQYYGKRPVDLIQQARMAHAADQLRRTTIPVVEIALDCGVENLGHFYEVFRSAHGLSPAAYRRSQADVAINV